MPTGEENSRRLQHRLQFCSRFELQHRRLRELQPRPLGQRLAIECNVPTSPSTAPLVRNREVGDVIVLRVWAMARLRQLNPALRVSNRRAEDLSQYEEGLR